MTPSHRTSTVRKANGQKGQTWGHAGTGVVKPCRSSGSGRRSSVCVVSGNESVRRKIGVSQEMIRNSFPSLARGFLPASIIFIPTRASEDRFDSTMKINKVQVLTPLRAGHPQRAGRGTFFDGIAFSPFCHRALR